MIYLSRSLARVFLLAFLFTLAGALKQGQAVAAGQLIALPNVGGSQKYEATLTAVMYQSGTLTITRVASDSVHVVAAEGLPASDNTLNVDPQGAISQPSPQSPYIDLIDYVDAILAAAPANLQTGAQWDTKLSGMSPMETAAEALGAGNKNYHAHKGSVDVPITITTKLVSVSGDIMTFHGEGSEKQMTHTIGGPAGTTINTTIDFVLKSGVLQSGTRTTIFGTVAPGSPGVNISYATSLTAR